jgi:hypothetical protein
MVEALEFVAAVDFVEYSIGTELLLLVEFVAVLVFDSPAQPAKTIAYNKTAAIIVRRFEKDVLLIKNVLSKKKMQV